MAHQVVQKPDLSARSEAVRKQSEQKKPPPAKAGGLLARALGLHKEYLRARDRYASWALDPALLQRQFVRFWAMRLARDFPNAASLVDAGKVGREQHSELNQAKGLRNAYEQLAKQQLELMKQKQLWTEFDAEPEDRRDQVLWELLCGFSESEVGRTYLAQQLQDGKSFFNRWIATAIKDARKDQSAAWKVLFEYVPVIVVTKGEVRAAAALHDFVAVKFGVKVPLVGVHGLQHLVDLGDRFVVDQAHVLARVQFFDYTNVDVVKKLGNAKKAAELVFDTANLLLALYSVSVAMRDQKAWHKQLKEWVGLTGAIASLTDKFQRTADWLASNEYKSLRIQAVAKDAPGRWRLLVKAGAKGATKVTALAIVSGVCEVYTGGYDAWDRYTRGDVNAAIGFSLGAAGGLATSVGGALALWGGATAWAGWGVPILIGGAVVSAIGWGVVLACDGTDAERWLSHNLYGLRYGQDPAYAKWVNDLGAQAEALVDLVFPAKFHVDFAKNTLEVHLANVQSAWRIALQVEARWIVEGEERTRSLEPVAFQKVERDDHVELLRATLPPASPRIHPHETALPPKLTQVEVRLAVDAVGVQTSRVFERHATLDGRTPDTH